MEWQDDESQRGSALWLIVVVSAMASLMILGAVRLGTAAVTNARARNAADAAALAATTGGAGAAGRVASASGAVVSEVRVGVSGGRVDSEVVVAVDGPDGREVARAAAQRELPVGGTGRRAGLAPAMLAALARADDLLGEQVPIVSGHRSRANQQALWDARDSNPYPVARPGTSLHEVGLAVDVPLSFVARLLSVAAASGLCHPLPTSDPVHFVVCPITR